jgi:hypothetical protein
LQNQVLISGSNRLVYQTFNENATIITKFLHAFKPSLKYQNNSMYLTAPLKSPDCIFYSKDIEKPSWREAIIIGDLKRFPYAEDGLGQAIKYGHIALHENSPRKKIILFGSDLKTIKFALMSDQGNLLTHTLDFIKPSVTVTRGLTQLVAYLCAPLLELGYQGLTVQQIDGYRFENCRFLGQGSAGRVYEWKQTVLKVALSENYQQCIAERRNIMKIRHLVIQHNRDASFIPQVDLDTFPGLQRALIMTPVGIPITAYCHEKMNNSDINKIHFMASISLQVLQALDTLCKIGYCHGDLRPQNLVVYENKVIIVDWEGAIQEGSPPRMAMACWSFLSDRLLNHLHNDSPVATQAMSLSIKDDIESMIYSLYMLTTTRISPSWQSDISGFFSFNDMIDIRVTLLESCQCEPIRALYKEFQTKKDEASSLIIASLIGICKNYQN